MNEICSDRPRQGLGCWDVAAQRFGFSLPAVFIACSQRSLSVPKPANQNGGSIKKKVQKKKSPPGPSFLFLLSLLIDVRFSVTPRPDGHLWGGAAPPLVGFLSPR